jgi:hypothetical protein
MAAALSIVDFMSIPDEEFSMTDNKVNNPKYYEYGLKEATSRITFSALGLKTFSLVATPITQYALFYLFYKNYLAENHDKIFAINGNNKLNKSSFGSRFNDDLVKFNKYFEEWLSEMSTSSVSFSALDISVKRKDILNLVTGNPEKMNKFNPFEKKGLEAFIEELARTDEKENFDALGDSNKKLFATFANATGNLISKKIGLSK